MLKKHQRPSGLLAERVWRSGEKVSVWGIKVEKGKEDTGGRPNPQQ